MKQPIQLSIEKPVYGGDFLGHVEGKAVFVPLTLPGETVRANLTEEKRSFAKAEIDAVLTASPNRIEPNCPHFGACGGCHYQYADYPTQLALKQQILRETLTRANVPIPAEIGILAGDPWAYRNRIRLALTQDGELAYRSRRSHDLIAIGECPIAAPILLRTAMQVAEFLAKNPPITHVSELELFTNQDESELLLSLFTETTSANDTHHTWLTALQASLPQQTSGIRLQLNDGGLNSQILAAIGQPSLTYTAADFSYRVDHGAFFQVNRHLVDDFVSLVIADHSGNLAWDLYAGVGLFARQLTQSCTEVIAVESAPASGAALQHNLKSAKAQPITSTTLDFLRRNRELREPRPDLIVLDPPRTGLGDQVTTLLNAIHAPAMVYVSCDPATLARDLRQLTQERYTIDSISLVDMFPQTFHLETVVHLRRT
jgi:23S rRNA (uracil1939-C5)-methyltransferase